MHVARGTGVFGLRRARCISGMLLGAIVVIGISGCPRLPRERVESLPDRPYPTCEDSAPATFPRVVGDLRSGPVMRDETVVEHFEIAPDGCHVVFSMRQEWALGATDIHAIYDAELNPLRVWRRATAPGPQPVAVRTEIRRYDLRGERVEMLQRTGDGSTSRFLIGTGISVATLRALGWRPLAHGVLLWVVVSVMALVAVRAVL